MAIIKRAVGHITLSRIVDVVSTTYFYLLMPSAAARPSKPTVSPPPVYETEGYSGWSETEPSYTSGDTRSLYITIRTIYGDGSFEYTTPSLSSSYEAAKTAYNRAQSAMSLAGDINQYFWNLTSAYSTNVPAGTYITEVAQSLFKPNPSGGNVVIQSTGITIRDGITQLSSLTGQGLNFYDPNASQGNNNLILSINNGGILQSGNYSRGSDAKFSTNGTKIDLTNGDIITKYFRVSQGLENLNAGAYIYGTIEALDGRIGTGYTPAGGTETNYWEIGNYDDYNLHNTAKIIGHGSSFIQLGDASTWRLSTNRIHTGWYSDNDTVLHYPQDSNNKYWDFGIHAPYSDSPSGRGNDKFIYIRTQKAANNSLENLLYDLDDNYSTQQWDYKFWVDAEGKVHAQNFYIGNSTTPIGGGVGTTAEKIINSDSTYGKGSATQPIYIDSNGRPATTTYALNAAGAKGVDTSISAASTSTNLPTSQAVAAFVEGKGYITSYTDNKVQTSQANTTKVFLAGTSTAGTSTGTLNFDSNVYLTTTAGTLHATTFEGNLSGTASRATADGDGNTIKTTYLKLSGGNVTGAVSFGSSVSADELTAGDLVVNGAASFTNNLQANTINGVEVGANPKFTDTVTTVTVTGNGNAVTSASASNGTVTLTKGTTFLTSYTETDPIFKASAAYGISNTDISNWNSKTSNTGTVTSVRVQASSPLISTSNIASSTTLDTTIKFSNQNANLVLAGPSSGTSTAAPTFRSLVAADIPGLAWSKITSGKPTTLSGYGITDAVPSSRKVAGHALTSDVTISNSDVGLGNVINAKQITNITNEFKDGQNTGKLVIWRGESDSEVLEVQITAREATSATNATNAQYATYDASEASNTTKTTIANKYIAKSIGTAAGDIIYWSASGTPVRLAKGSNGQILKLANGVPTWAADNNTTYSAGTGLSLTGTTFANTGVTGVKGNAESTYRTGQVNLTAANVGAVATSGNETVSGNKTFSGTTSLTAGSTYPAQMGTVIPANSSAIIQSPVPKYLWHDLWAFCRATTPTYYTTTDGTNWTQGTLDKRLFGHANAWGVSNVISNTISGSRWVWHGGGFAYCSGAWLALGVAYSDKIAKFDLKLEGTSDATATSPTWTELCSVTNARYNQTPIWIKTNGPSVNDVRLTITRASGEATTTMLPLCSIMWLSSRWGNQGRGEEYEHPYSWDSNYNIYPLSGAKFVGDVTGNASGTASNVTGTVAIDNGGTGATSAQNATWNLLHVSDPGDLNNAKRGGSFKISNTTTNTPVNGMWGATINVTDDSAGGNTGTSGSTWQIVLQSGNNNMWLRCITNANSWTDYAKFYTTANKPTKSDIGLINVENKSSATIRGELTSSNVTTALGYTPVNKAGDTMTGALNMANGIANKIGDDSQLGDFNVGGTLGIQGLNAATGIALLQQGTTWGSSGNYVKIGYDGTTATISKQTTVTGNITSNGLLKSTNSNNTVTIGSQNASYTHIYNSVSIPFIFNNSILTTSGSLGDTTYPFTDIFMKGGLNMLVNTTQKARMAYDDTLAAIVFSFA